MSSEIKVNTISEYTGAAGVTIDGVNLKDSVVKTDTISEKTSAAGVTIDSVLLKDGVSHSGLVKLASATASASSELLFDNFVDTSTYAYYHIALDYIKIATDTQNFEITFRQGGGSGSDLTGTYRRYNNYANVTASSISTYTTTQTDATTLHMLGNSTREEYSGTLDFFPANGTNGFSHIKSLGTYKDYDGNIFATITTNLIDVATATTGLKFNAASGNITSGTITVYGVKL